MNSVSGAKDSEEESTASAIEAARTSEKAEPVCSEEELVEKTDDPMERESVNPSTVFRISLKQPRSNLQHKMSVPELCRNFR